MDENTAVDQTPVTEEVVEKEPSRRELLEQAYDKANAEEPAKEPEPEKAEEPKVEEPASEPDVPTDIPGNVRQHWKDIPEPAREAILKSQREMSGKLSQVSRETTAFKPIRDMMTRAMKEIPGTSDLTPQQFAEQMWYLAQAGQRLNTDKEGAIRDLAKQHNIDLAKLAGQASQQPQNTQDQQTIRELRQQVQTLNQHLQRVADPNYIRQQFDQYQTETTTATTVQEFAAQNEHWNAVEDKLPAYVQAVKTIAPDAAPMQVLERAYQMAVNDAGLTRATETAGDEPAADAPQRVKTAVKAKSVNVKSGPGTNSKPSDPKALMGQVYDRMMNS
jgi:hypothetical protein